MKATYVIIAVILIAIALGGGFYGGMVYAQGQTQAQDPYAAFQRQRGAQTDGQAAQQAAAGPCGFPQRAGRQGTNGGQGANGGQNATGGQNGNGGQFANGGQFGNLQQFGNCVARGDIKSIDSQAGTMQVSTPVNVVTVKLSGQTTVSKTAVGALADLKVGDRVTVLSKDSGDNPTASLIQLQGGIGQ